jgi:hypothetical protein
MTMGTDRARIHEQSHRPRLARKGKPHPRRDGGRAFFSDPGGEPAVAPDELAESLAEEFLASATSAEEVTESQRAVFLTEEIGGPFLEVRLRVPDADHGLDEEASET